MKKKQQKNDFETEIWWILFFLPNMDAALKSINFTTFFFFFFSSFVFPQPGVAVVLQTVALIIMVRFVVVDCCLG